MKDLKPGDTPDVRDMAVDWVRPDGYRQIIESERIGSAPILPDRKNSTDAGCCSCLVVCGCCCGLWYSPFPALPVHDNG